MRISLAGNPNSGKTTIFNALTGASQRVGNWSGVTVDKKTGTCQVKGTQIEVTDLPGTYSLSVVSLEGSLDERIACEHIMNDQADLIVNVIDAANLERNLYLTTQLLEMQVPVLLAVNMTDIARKRGLHIDIEQLSRLTQCPAVAMVGRSKHGVGPLTTKLAQLAEDFNSKQQLPVATAPTYDHALEQTITDLLPAVEQAQNSQTSELNGAARHSDARWLAIRLLENDIYAKQLCGDDCQLCPAVATAQAKLEQQQDEDAELLLADARYQWINSIVSRCSVQKKLVKQTITDGIDRIALNRWLGIPLFLAVMYLMFEFAINLGGALQPLFDNSSRTIFIDGTMYLGHQLHIPLWLTAILGQGLGLGINTVITFVPQIGGMFLFLAFLEDSGYMARAAFVMDRFMQWVGLPGKSFVPLIVGFGCNVPAIMATRTLESRRDRLLTIMMSPFMSCGARLAIFAVFAGAFFPRSGAAVVFGLYLLGIAVALLTGLLVKKTLLPGKPTPFVMEMPPYHMPAFANIGRSAWHRLKRFLLRAGKVIVPICILVGTLNTIEPNGSVTPGGSSNSVLSHMGQSVTPVLSPMGVSQQNWPATVGLITGFLAKEVVVGTLNTLYTQNNAANQFDPSKYSFWGGLNQALTSTYHGLTHIGKQGFINPITANEAEHNMTQTAMGHMATSFGGTLAAFSYMLFVLLYVPCVSTIGVTAREANQSWAILSTVWSLVIAYALAVIVYQSGSMLTQPITSVVWILAMLALLALTIWGMKSMGDHLKSARIGVSQGGKNGGCH